MNFVIQQLDFHNQHDMLKKNHINFLNIKQTKIIYEQEVLSPPHTLHASRLNVPFGIPLISFFKNILRIISQIANQ